MKVEITKNNSKQSVHTLTGRVEVSHRTPENKVAKLSVGNENNHEHYQKTDDIERAFGQSCLQLFQSFIKADVLEQFYP